MNEDFKDLLDALIEAEAIFLVVGAHALAVHGVPRATGDIDIWVRPDEANAESVWRALARFGAPLKTLGIQKSEFVRADQVVQIGMPPRRIDVLTSISGVTFDEAWSRRVVHDVSGRSIPFLGRDDLVRNKRASGRTKDKADLEALGETE